MALVVRAGKIYMNRLAPDQQVKVSRVTKDLVRWYPVSGGGREQSTARDVFLLRYVVVDENAVSLDTAP